MFNFSFYNKIESKNQKGVTLIEVVVSIAIFAILSVSIYGLFTSIINGINFYREQTTISALADQYLEIARNTSYSQVKASVGNSDCTQTNLLASQSCPLTATVGGKAYNIYYTVTCISDAQSKIPASCDYVHVKVYIQNVSTNAINSFLTTIAQ